VAIGTAGAPGPETGKRIAWAATRRSQESGGRPAERCTRKGFRALVDVFERRRGAEGAGRWDRCDGRGGSETSSSTCNAISIYEVGRVSGTELHKNGEDHRPKLSPQMLSVGR